METHDLIPHEGNWLPEPLPNLTGRVAWLIAGFNLGFILIMVLMLVLMPMVIPTFTIRRSEGAENQPQNEQSFSYEVVTALPTLTIESTATLPPPTATPSMTPDFNATGTQVARLAQAVASFTPALTTTPLPSPTLIPPTPTPLPPPDSYQKEGITFVRQTWNNCGPANLAMGLSYFDWAGGQADTGAFLKPDREDKNVTPQEMVNYVNQFTNLRAIWRMAGELDQIRWLTANGFLVIVESGFEPGGEGWFGHYETVVGYDNARETITIYDSYLGSASRPYVIYSIDQFDRQWQTFNRNYIVIYPPEREWELQAFLGTDWIEFGNRRKAVEIAQREASEDQENAFVWFNLGTSLTAIGRYEEAVVAFEKALEIGLPYRMLWYQFAPYEAFLQTGRLESVLTLANNTLKTTRYVEETFYYKGRVYEIQGNYAAALEQYNEAVTFNPNHTPSKTALARVQELVN